MSSLEKEINKAISINMIMLAFAFGIIMLMGFANAVTTLPPVKQNQCVDLPQSEYGSTYQNISGIQLPNETIVNKNIPMTKLNNLYNYTFCNTYALGTYVVNGFSDLSTWAYDFEVTASGSTTNTYQGIIYVALLAILFFLFVLSIYGGFKLPSENTRTADGEIIQIEWKKYLKWFCWVLSYLIILWMVYIGWNLAYAFLYFDTMANIFKMLFTIQLGLLPPIFIVSTIMGVINFLKDKKIYDKLERGLTAR